MANVMFSLKVAGIVLDFNDANFAVSPQFKKSEVNEMIKQKLKELGFKTDLNAINYVLKDGQLYAEGMAYEHQKASVDFEFTI